MTDGLWWGGALVCDSIGGARIVLSTADSEAKTYCSPARTLTVRVFRAWRLTFACVWVLEMLGGTK